MWHSAPGARYRTCGTCRGAQPTSLPLKKLQLTEGPFWPRYKVGTKTFPSAPSNDHLESSRLTQQLFLCSSGHSHLALTVCLLPKRYTSSTKSTSVAMQETQPSSPGWSLKTLRQHRLSIWTKGFGLCPCIYRLIRTQQYVCCLHSEESGWSICICEQGIKKRLCILHRNKEASLCLAEAFLASFHLHYLYIVHRLCIFYTHSKSCIA